MQRLSPKSTVNRGLLQGGEGVLLARRMRMLCWWSKRLRCFDMVKDAFHPIVTPSFFFAGHPHPSRSAPPSPPWGRPPMPFPLGNRRCIFVIQQRREQAPALRQRGIAAAPSYSQTPLPSLPSKGRLIKPNLLRTDGASSYALRRRERAPARRQRIPSPLRQAVRERIHEAPSERGLRHRRWRRMR